MEQNTDFTQMLDFMLNPVFCAENNRITKLNQAAARLFLREGLSLEPLFESGAEEYAAFSGGMLYVTLSICGQNRGASIRRIGAVDIFSLDQEFESEELQVLALAARELRGPLTNAMIAAQQIDDEDKGNTSRLNRGLYQLLRIVSNMSDASGCTTMFRPEYRNADALFREMLQKAAAASAFPIEYTGLSEEASWQLDAQQLERAVLNMLSNAIKFAEPGSTIQASLSRFGKGLRFSVTNQGNAITEETQSTLFRRYLREPAIEDSRHGIGLGMLLIRNAAASHGGAVLVDHPAPDQTRISITISLNRQFPAKLHTSRLNVDYAGEQDHVLTELSELLPYDLY